MDRELSPEKMPPMSELQQPQPAPIPTSWDPAIFRQLDAEHDFSDLRKTRSHSLLQSAGAFVPPIYVARGSGTEALDPESALWRDLHHLMATPTILRFDVPLGRTEWTNLPTIGPLTSIDEAKAKVTEAIKAVLRRGIDLNELSMVVHHFIAARASAWSEAQPGSPSIRIDATWGLPDGLQTFVHDSIVCDLASGTFLPHVRYKDRFIDIDRTGSWITRKAYPALALELSCGHRVAREIAEITTRVADATGRPVRIMWFLDVLQGGGGATPEAMPWIVVEVENGGLLPPWTTPQPSDEALRRLADLHRRKAVTNRTTLALFRRNPSAADIGGRHVLLQPDASAVRDRQFLVTFADVVRGLPNQWTVLYAGSMLAHTPYQLQQLGVGVLPLHAEVRTPRRTFSRKLVRDGIPSRIAAGGEHAEVVPLDVDQYRLALRQELVEEALEVAYAGDAYELREELADLLEVAKSIVTASELKGWNDVEEEVAEKRKRRGGFEARLYLRATSYAIGGTETSPGGAPIQRLRSHAGVRIPLVPPLLSHKGSAPTGLSGRA